MHLEVQPASIGSASEAISCDAQIRFRQWNPEHVCAAGQRENRVGLRSRNATRTSKNHHPSVQCLVKFRNGPLNLCADATYKHVSKRRQFTEKECRTVLDSSSRLRHGSQNDISFLPVPYSGLLSLSMHVPYGVSESSYAVCKVLRESASQPSCSSLALPASST